MKSLPLTESDIALIVLVIAGALMMVGLAWAMPELFERREEE